MKTIILSSVAAVFAFGTATAQEFGAIDTDNDGIITFEEWQVGVGEAEKTEGWADIWDYDTDQDEMLTRDEVAQGMWTHYDVTGDNTWSPDELKAWEEDQLRYNATRSGREISPPG